MGCGSSTVAAEAAVVPAAQAGPSTNGHAGKQQATAPQQQQQQQQPQQAQGSQQQQQQSGAPPGSSPRKAKKHLQRNSRSDNGDEATAAAAAADGAAPPNKKAAARPLPPCDGDPSHEALWWCAACEENLCGSCDATVHQQAETRAHKRTSLTAAAAANGSGSSAAMMSPNERKQAKFVVRSAAPEAGHTSNASAPGAHGSSSSDAQQSPVPNGGSAKPKFTVAKFSSTGEGAAGDDGKVAVSRKLSSNMIRDKEGDDRGAGGRGASSPMRLSNVDDSELARMSRSELESLWSRYDKDRNGVLSRSELRSLAADVIARLLQLLREDIARSSGPGMTESELDELVAREKFFVLPGKDIKQSQAEMTRMLAESLDINGDGRVSQQEYFAQWNEFANDVFQLKKDGAIACSIM